MRLELLTTEPFFGLLALRMPLVEDWSCETMWVDGVNLGYNPGYVDSLLDVELKGVICHEVLHVSGGHPWRIGNREHERWNEACDYAINPVVLAGRYVLPDDVLFDEKYVGLAAESIFNMLPVAKPKPNPQPNSGKGEDKNEGENEPQGGDSAGDESGTEGDQGEEGKEGNKESGKGKPAKSSSDKEAQSGEGKGQPGNSGKSKPRAGEVRKAPSSAKPDSQNSEQAWMMAVQAASMAQGNKSAALERFIKDALRPRMNYREVLYEFVQASNHSPDYVWKRPSRRFWAFDIYMPSLEGFDMQPLVAAIDTSSSVPDEDIARAQADLQGILDDCRPEVLIVVYCDAEVMRVERFEPGDTVKLHPKGGGGTDFRPLFDWVAKNAPEAAGILYLTDMFGTFPEKCDIPTLWIASSLTPPRQLEKAPFGTVIQLPAELLEA